jgi:hypothetical protein
MIDGERPERRPAEAFGLAAMRAAGPLLGRYRPTPVATIVSSMVAQAKAERPGHRVVEPQQMG